MTIYIIICIQKSDVFSDSMIYSLLSALRQTSIFLNNYLP